MASDFVVNKSIDTLGKVYANQIANIDEVQLDLIRKQFERATDAAVLYAVRKHVEANRFFPAVSEMVTLIREHNAKPSLLEGGLFPGSKLEAKRRMLEADCAAGIFIPDEWHALADEFKAAGRPGGAASVERHLAGHLKAIKAAA